MEKRRETAATKHLLRVRVSVRAGVVLSGNSQDRSWKRRGHIHVNGAMLMVNANGTININAHL